MCGVVGLVGQQAVAQEICDALTLLQHRGQDAAGMMTSDQGQIHVHKAQGLVRDVFSSTACQALPGHMGIGHVRYPTAGGKSDRETQPFFVNAPYGLGICHNGQLTNTKDLSKHLLEDHMRHLNTESDSEVLLNVFAHHLQQQAAQSLTPEHLFASLTKLYQHCVGGYAAVILVAGQGVLGFRDPWGIRPLVLGCRTTETGKAYMLASETVALDVLGYEFVDDIKPGEAVFLSKDGQCMRHQCAAMQAYKPCLFEFIYLARPDSVIDGMSVYQFRLRLGVCLSEVIRKQGDVSDIDVVIPVPETSLPAAHALALELQKPYRHALVKNRYIGRTFIMPGQTIRKKSVRQKLNTIRSEFKGRHVLLVDDSIVRGTTAREIVKMAYEAGATKVSLASASPVVCHNNYYGIDMPCKDDLLGHNRSIDAMASSLGVCALYFVELADIERVSKAFNRKVPGFEDSVFSGHYITDVCHS